MQKIHIKITGPVGVGKSTVAAIIDKTLKAYGFDVGIQEDIRYGGDEKSIVAAYAEKLDPKNFSSGSTRTSVTIESAT